MNLVAALLLALPLTMAAVIGLLHRRLTTKQAGVLAFAMTATCFGLAVAAFTHLRGLPVDERFVEATFWRWIELGGADGGAVDGAATRLALDVGVWLDPLSVTWALFVTGVGSLIFLYSISYMAHEQGGARYFAYLCLFLFSMLTLVLGSNLVLTFLGWEGVGLCSYLLIGFEYGKETAAQAGRKAFLLNRIGDIGFLIGMFWTWKLFGTLGHGEMKPLMAGALAAGAVIPPLLALSYFVGACGKSAQLPLFVWLPDAMAGPTPVSALIHAATMVTAGVYLLCRLSPLFAAAAWALDVVAWTGAATALFAGLIALRQRDIKRVLAYSTVSQLGYMFLACGLGAFASGAFHVVTHAFFKALLFLGSGAVIHALHGEQDLWKMGGLKHHLPKTAFAMRIGAFALAGIAPFAGFFSKDEILGVAFAQAYAGDRSRWVLWGMGVLTAALTAFYTARMITLCFDGESRLDPHAHAHPHEAPPAMAIPLQILAVLSLAGGIALGFEALHWMPLHHWLEPVLAPAPDLQLSSALTWGLMTLAFLIAVLAWRIGAKWYSGDFAAARAAELSLPRLARVLAGRFFVDEIYGGLIVRPLRFCAELALEFDQRVVDGLFRGIGTAAVLLGTAVRIVQNGVIHSYAFWVLAGTVTLLAVALS
ncbi:MAG: NADH-quinone oxidoreductase subunit L [Planctomycetes bacterium]|nr:NADH-quinone oxidoreductase subunit L [Planctomycetota bacterium]